MEKWGKAERDQKQPFVDYRFLSANYAATANGRRVLVTEESRTAENGEDTVYYRGVFFSLPTGSRVLIIYTNSSFKDTVLPDFEQVVDSVTALNP